MVDGEEGSGKSVFGMQLAKALDPDFDMSRLCFTADEFTKAIIRAKKGQCVVYDEAFTGLSARGSLTEVNRLLVSLMMEMRQKNLFVIIVMPTFFLLDKYVALWRAKGLFHVYTKQGKRGFWMYFNRQKKKELYLTGRKLYEYSRPRSSFRGRFFDQYTVDESEYRKRKQDALNKKSRVTRSHTYMEQRNILLYLLNKKYDIPQKEISHGMQKAGNSLSQNSISESIAHIEGEIKFKQMQDAVRNESAAKTP